MGTQDMIQKMLRVDGFNEALFNRLRCTRQYIQIKHLDSKGGVSHYAVITNHYFGGKNYWECRPRPNLVFYYGGETFDELNLDLDFAMVASDEDYRSYNKKFVALHPLEIITIKYVNKDYKSMPKPERKDNRSVRVGSGGSSQSSVRFPSQKRGRSTWKRFWKLFPQYDGCRSIREYYQKQLEKIKQETTIPK
jgi:hypothetical protein